MMKSQRDARLRERTRRAQRGATMVEFALYFLLFLALTIGLMELGRGIWTYTSLSHAARAGARYAQVFKTYDGAPPGDVEQEIRDVVKENAIGLDIQDAKVEIAWEKLDFTQDPPVWVDDSADKTAGSTVEVRVKHTFQLVAAPLILGQNSIELGSVSRMVVAN